LFVVICNFKLIRVQSHWLRSIDCDLKNSCRGYVAYWKWPLLGLRTHHPNRVDSRPVDSTQIETTPSYKDTTEVIWLIDSGCAWDSVHTIRVESIRIPDVWPNEELWYCRFHFRQSYSWSRALRLIFCVHKWKEKSYLSYIMTVRQSADFKTGECSLQNKIEPIQSFLSLNRSGFIWVNIPHSSFFC